MLSLGLTLEPSTSARARSGLVGPNAVIQLAAALRSARVPQGSAERIFSRAGALRFLVRPPHSMIDENIPARLFEALWCEMPPDEAAIIARDAGRRTGAYLLANRIPPAARLLLRALPSRLACSLLLRAIRRNSWTFAGSGACSVAYGSPAIITISGNPLAMPGGWWHVGVFECLFAALVRDVVTVGHEENRLDAVRVSRFPIAIRSGPVARTES